MFRKTRCDTCGHPVAMHVTDALADPVATAHLCERHAPEEYRTAIQQIARLFWNNTSRRDSATDFIATELVLPRDLARQRLEDWMRDFGG